MKLLVFFQKNWNLLFIVAGVIVTTLTKFAIPPAFATTSVYGEIDYNAFSKFMAGACIGLFLVPASFFNERRYSITWGLTAVCFLVAAVFIQFKYYHVLDDKTVWEEDSQQRYVIGDTYIPAAKAQIDSFTVSHPAVHITPEILIAGMGGADHIWPAREIRDNYKMIVRFFMATIILYALFIISLMQSLYCASRPKVRRKPLPGR